VNKDSERLQKIFSCIQKIELFTKEGKDSFFADEMQQDAVLRNFQVMGDAIKDLTPEFKNAHPEVSWREPSRFRDRVTHDYLEVKMDIVWDTVEKHLPVFKAQIQKLLDDSDHNKA
jgi:uncharacterized protein with HEPN domain